MRIIMTICSGNKNMDTNLLPAKKRYLSNRIKIVDQISKKEKLPFYILSGKFGVIRADKLIPWYDKQLGLNDIKTILPIIVGQLRREDITEIIFYGKEKNDKGWTAYHEAIDQASNKLGIKLIKKIITDY